jgi:spectinomycin phosphotransferase
MYFGGGQGFAGYSAAEEQALFFAGYGDAQVDQAALAYYRYERIVQDVFAFCNELLASTGDGENRRQSLRWLAANFAAGGAIDVARAADQTGM